MSADQQLLYMDKNYTILQAEQEFIIHPVALGLLTNVGDPIQQPFAISLYLKGYQLMLDQVVLSKHENEMKDYVQAEALEKSVHFDELPVSYNGTVLIGFDLVKEYSSNNQKPACFSYRSVFELVFEDGILITTIDQSRAMQRIRKNIELGLRSLTKKRDIRCINHFMKSCFVGDYHTNLTTKKRLRYIKDMKKEYLNKTISFSDKN